MYPTSLVRAECPVEVFNNFSWLYEFHEAINARTFNTGVRKVVWGEVAKKKFTDVSNEVKPHRARGDNRQKQNNGP